MERPGQAPRGSSGRRDASYGFTHTPSSCRPPHASSTAQRVWWGPTAAPAAVPVPALLRGWPPAATPIPAPWKSRGASRSCPPPAAAAATAVAAAGGSAGGCRGRRGCIAMRVRAGSSGSAAQPCSPPRSASCSARRRRRGSRPAAWAGASLSRQPSTSSSYTAGWEMGWAGGWGQGGGGAGRRWGGGRSAGRAAGCCTEGRAPRAAGGGGGVSCAQ